MPSHHEDDRMSVDDLALRLLATLAELALRELAERRRRRVRKSPAPEQD